MQFFFVVPKQITHEKHIIYVRDLARTLLPPHADQHWRERGCPQEVDLRMVRLFQRDAIRGKKKK